MVVALPMGLLSAIYLSEYASTGVRRVVKPVLELLAGIPTVVYGYFALLFVTPLLQRFVPALSGFNALSPGIVMGIMILPLVSSLAEDAMRGVPRGLREGSYALGATKMQTSLRVVVPAAFSGITAAFILAVSRAIGETMIVAIAAGQQPRLTFDPDRPGRNDDRVHRPDQPRRHAAGHARISDDLRGRHAALHRHVWSEPGERVAARALPGGVRVSQAAPVALGTASTGRGLAWRRFADVAFQVLALVVLLIALACLGALIYDIVADGAGRLSWSFITNFSSRRASQAGIWPALTGSIFIILVTALLAIPVGVAAAIYLEEYGGRSLAARIIELNITNLAAVPSIIYGLLGLGLFVRMMGMGRSVLAGASTLALLVLPVVILSTREALRAVPGSLREGSYALGATKWQTIWHQVLPVAAPGILTGLILALSRAIGETAPLIIAGAVTFATFAPDSVWSPFTVLPIQIFNWVSRPQVDFHTNAAAGILVLVLLLLSMNASAIWLRDRYQKRGAA